MQKRIRITVLFIVAMVIITIFLIFIASNKSNSDTSKTNIIASFNENKSTFENIRRYAISLEDNIYIYLNGKEVVYDENQKESIIANKMGPDIEYILKKLQFVGIYGDNGNVKFVKIDGNTETGIYYNKDNIMLKNIPAASYFEKITDNWVYYEEYHT